MYYALGRNEQGTQTTQFYLCRFYHLLCLDASCWDGKRSHRALLPLARGENIGKNATGL